MRLESTARMLRAPPKHLRERGSFVAPLEGEQWARKASENRMSTNCQVNYLNSIVSPATLLNLSNSVKVIPPIVLPTTHLQTTHSKKNSALSLRGAEQTKQPRKIHKSQLPIWAPSIFACPLGVVSLFKVGSPIPLIIPEKIHHEGASHLALGVPRLGVKSVFSVASNTIELSLAVQIQIKFKF